MTMRNIPSAGNPKTGRIVANSVLATLRRLTATLTAEGYAPYAGAKAGINHATRIAASEYGAQGVRINVVSASLVETPMTAQIVNAPSASFHFGSTSCVISM